jgi:CBS domain-containing protein
MHPRRRPCISFESPIMQLRDFTTGVVETLTAATTIEQAAKTMRERDLGWMPVEDADQVVGVVTDRDIVVRGVASALDPKTPIREIMTKSVLSCNIDDDVDDACDLMQREQVRRLVVLDDDGKLAGVVALADIARRGDDDQSADVLQRVSEPE